MTRKERKDYILALDKVVNRWKRNSKLFCGGCCFSAGQIAKLLETKGIRYQVVCWKAGYLNEKCLEEIIININCCHVAIQVSLDSMPFIIGGMYRGGSATDVKIFRTMYSKNIIDCDELGVVAGAWNKEYKRKLNGRFVGVLHKAVSK